jgi:hypothetical protein
MTHKSSPIEEDYPKVVHISGTILGPTASILNNLWQDIIHLWLSLMILE